MIDCLMLNALLSILKKLHRLIVVVLTYKHTSRLALNRDNGTTICCFGESPKGVACIAEVSCFLEDKLAQNGNEISIQRAYIIGRVQRQTLIGRSANAQPRPLIALFRDYLDVELVLSNANKLQDTPFGINCHYPREIINARKHS